MANFFWLISKVKFAKSINVPKLYHGPENPQIAHFVGKTIMNQVSQTQTHTHGKARNLIIYLLTGVEEFLHDDTEDNKELIQLVLVSSCSCMPMLMSELSDEYSWRQYWVIATLPVLDHSSLWTFLSESTPLLQGVFFFPTTEKNSLIVWAAVQGRVTCLLDYQLFT